MEKSTHEKLNDIIQKNTINLKKTNMEKSTHEKLTDNKKEEEIIFMFYPKIDSIYKHYKGGTYKVLFLSKHTETNEILVNYKSILFGTYYSRPLTSWNDTVLSQKTNTHAYRFELNRFELIS